jgi:hypothetical protein
MTCVRADDDEDHCFSLKGFADVGRGSAFKVSRTRNAPAWCPITARAQVTYGIRTESTQLSIAPAVNYPFGSATHRNYGKNMTLEFCLAKWTASRGAAAGSDDQARRLLPQLKYGSRPEFQKNSAWSPRYGRRRSFFVNLRGVSGRIPTRPN